MLVFSGIYDVLWGLRQVVTAPALLRLALAPLLFAAIPTAFLWIGYRGLSELAANAANGTGMVSQAKVTQAIDWFDGVFWGAAYVFLAVILAILTTPFCERISERVEHTLTGTPPPRISLGRTMFEILRGVLHATRRGIVYLISLAILCVVLLLPEPVDDTLYAIGSAYLTVRFTSYDALDTLWARKNWRYRQKVDYLRARRGRAYGLGAAIALLLLVPGLNLLAFPAGAAGAVRQHLGTSPRG